MSFSLIESILRLIVSVSMLTALPTASIKTGSLVRLGQLFPSSEFFDNPGQSLIQSAKYLLSWFRIGRYLQCPPRKEPQDTRFATSPTRPSYSPLRTFRRGSQVPRNPSIMVSIALRDQLIKSIIFQFGEQCRESLSIRDKGAKQGR